MDGHSSHNYEYKQYPRRWFMLAIIFILNLVIQIIFISFAPIASTAASYYDVSTTAVNWLALIWSAVFIPCTALAAWGFSKYGTRNCLISSALMMLLGCLVRLISLAFRSDDEAGVERNTPAGYSFVLVGTLIIAIVQPFVLSSTTLIAAAWFSEKQRNSANTLMSAANPLGLALGALLSPTLVSESSTDGITDLLIVQAAMAALTLSVTTYLRSDPPSAPCATAGSARRRPRELVPELKQLQHNFGYITLCNVFSLAVGALQATLTLIEQILAPAGYNSDDAGQLAAIIIFSGILGIAVVGPVLDRARCYKLVLAGSLTLALPFYLTFKVYAFREDSLPLLAAMAAGIGLLGFPVLPAALDMSAEVAYPASAGLTTAILWCGSQVTSLVLVTLIDGPLEEDGAPGEPDSLEAGTWLLVGCMTGATILSWLWSGRYIRKEMEDTVQRLRQAQRRDTGLPFVDIIDPAERQPSVAPYDHGGATYNVAAAAAASATRRGSHIMDAPSNLELGGTGLDEVELTMAMEASDARGYDQDMAPEL